MKLLTLFIVVSAFYVVACGGRCDDPSCAPPDANQACSDLVDAICKRRVECGVASDFATCAQSLGAEADCANSGGCSANTSYDPQAYLTCYDDVTVADCSAALIATDSLNIGSVGCADPVCK